MEVDFVGGRYVARCSFEERLYPQRAGFKFDTAIKRWVTHNPATAVLMGAYLLTDRARATLGITSKIPVPEGREYLPFQTEGITYGLEHHSTLIADQPGLGKGHPVTTPILTPTGYRPLGSIKVGDRIVGMLGTSVLVTAIYPRGVIPVYRITFSDGASIVCDGDHLWSLDQGGEEFETIDTLALAARVRAGADVAIPVLTAPVVSPPRSYAIPPRVAGIDAAQRFGIGGRYFKHAYAEELVRDYAPYAEGASWQRIDFLSSVVRAIGRIRDDAIRLRLCDRPGALDLARVIRDVTQRLGGIAYQRKGFRHLVLDLYVPDEVGLPLFGYHKRRERIRRRWRAFEGAVPRRRIVSVKPAGRDEVRCLAVQGYANLYVADHGIVTHNTIQAIGMYNAIPNLKTGVIVCPASLKGNWIKEWAKWSTRTDLSIDVAYGNSLPKSDIVVINYDILARHRAALRQREIDLLTCDEAHGLKNEDAKRTKEVYGGKEKVKLESGKKVLQTIIPLPRRRLLLLSGTPIPNRLSDLWTTIHACDPMRLGYDRMKYLKEYCGAYDDFHGFVKDGTTDPAKLAELNMLMKSRFMIRRLKTDVLKDLPPKIRQIVPLPVDGLKRAVAAEKETLLDLLDAYEKIVGIRKEMTDAELITAVLSISPKTWEKYAETQGEDAGSVELPLTRLARARQDLAVAKLPMVIEFVQNLLDQGEKVVVFGYHTAVIEGLMQHFADKVGTACIYGKTPMNPIRKPETGRQAQAERFQNDPECRLFVGQYTAAGTGFTLTMACHFVAAELVWVPHELLQAEDRCHRIGSEMHETVWAHHLCVEGSLDDTFIAKLIEKMAIIEQALD